MEASAPNIFEFTDYHQFFKAFYHFNKSKKNSFSFRYLARYSGISASMVAAIINGKRRISPAIAKKLAKTLNLSARESDYLFALVGFEKARNHTDKNEAFSRIVRLRGQTKLKYLHADQYEYFSKWYHSAIRELISIPFFKEDPVWIAQTLQPVITVKQAQRSLELLQRLNLARRDESGALRVTDKAISSEYEMQSLSLRNFSLEMIDRAKESLETVAVAKREISGLTMGVSDECIDRIKHRIRIFKEEIISMVVDDKNEATSVYQMNFQFFPLLKSNDSTEKGCRDEL